MSAEAVQSRAVSLTDIAALTAMLRGLANLKIEQIQKITSRMRILALNAMIESGRAGEGSQAVTHVAE